MSAQTIPTPPPAGPVAPRVLILDDDPAVRGLLHEIVRETIPASRILVAVEGETALDLIAEEIVDIAFVDLVLPDSAVSGVLVCQALCREGRTRVVVVSGLNSSAVREACEVMGIAGFLPKPLSAALVRAHLEAWQPAPAPPEAVSASFVSAP